MRYLISLLFIFFLSNCTNDNKVFWCGDHACVNKAERESYFKKTMIVEVKNFNKDNYNKKLSELDYIKKEFNIAGENKVILRKKSTKQLDISELSAVEKRKIAKEVRLEKKRIINEQKALARKNSKNEKIRLKEEKLLAKKIEKDIKINKKKDNKKLVKSTNVFKINTSSFKKIVENIKNKNKSKSYPDINLKD